MNDVETKKKGSFLGEIPLWAKIFFGIFLFAALMLSLCVISEDFADFYNENIASVIRIFLAKLTNFLPFSLAEYIVIMLPTAVIFTAIFAAKRYADSWRRVAIFCVSLLCVASLVASAFLLTFAAGYHTSPLEKKLSLTRKEVSADELYDTAIILRDKINEESKKIDYLYGGFSHMPYGFKAMNDELIEAYDRAKEKYGFIDNFGSRVKPVMMSRAMSYTHITGVYSFFTGEANVNVDFPDYTLPYTAAHELAHQRGFAREDEANFVAYLVCIESDDAYIRYSAYLNLYEYVASALYRAAPDRYFEIAKTLSDSVKGELRAYANFFDKYRDSVASEVSGAVNNTFLTMQGTAGTASYGMVVDLAVAYYKNVN